ncbi:MAG: hypothetical protein M3139_15815 [Bacteroidota bacterium]|nr:hypothetical protein [Bacteroidota bacterium]
MEAILGWKSGLVAQWKPKLTEDFICFKESPSSNRFSIPEADLKNRIIRADELFSLFTASIIKEKVIFIR